GAGARGARTSRRPAPVVPPPGPALRRAAGSGIPVGIAASFISCGLAAARRPARRPPWSRAARAPGSRQVLEGDTSMPTQVQQSKTIATLTHDGKTLELPILKGSEGELAVDIEKLRSSTGLITMDPGYGNTGSCRSAITFIDGEQGILRYRGYPIEELAAHSSFLEVAWLLMNGDLPSHAKLTAFDREVKLHTMLHENFHRFFEALPKDAHPMPVCAAAVGALATFYQEPETEQNIHDTVVRLIAKMPTIAAYSYKHSIGQPSIYPQNRFDYSTNFLHMMFAT